MPCYFFSGQDYIRVHRGETGPGTVDSGYPMDLRVGWNTFPPNFDTSQGINSPLYDENGAYFFNHDSYIRMTRGAEGPGTLDAGYPKSIASLGYPAPFNQGPFDAALYSQSAVYFFKGQQYIRAARSVGYLGPMDPGYPRSISDWGWSLHNDFGTQGICGALNSGSVCYFFEKPGPYSEIRYVRVTRDATGAGTVDPGYPQNISVWGWGQFGLQGISGALYSGTDSSNGGIVFGNWP